VLRAKLEVQSAAARTKERLETLGREQLNNLGVSDLRDLGIDISQMKSVNDVKSQAVSLFDKLKKQIADGPAKNKTACLIGRAVFDHSDHVSRIAAMRDTWAADPSLRFVPLDFGKEGFEAMYRKWCTEPRNCPLKVSSAPDELPIQPVTGSRVPQGDAWVASLRWGLQEKRHAWFLLGQDMLYVHARNLRKLVEQYDPGSPVVLGNRLKGFGKDATMVSPWGFVLSRAAAELLVEKWADCKKRIEKQNFLAQSDSIDYLFSYCLQNKVRFPDTRDAEGRDTFVLWPPSRMEKGDWWDSWYPNMKRDAPVKAVSPDTVLFFFASAKEIRALHALVQYRGPGPFNGTAYKPETWRLLDSLRQ
jgi:hypothetical protein